MCKSLARFCFVFLFMFASSFAELDDVKKEINFHEYCVIGAGPGGLQMGYFLKMSGRDYIIFEKGSGAGTFYTKYPIHRTLISINKRFTGKTNKEFNMRHDWNSLLSHDESLRMTKYSNEFFPPADTLVKYLGDFARKFALNIRYNTTIGNLLKRDDELFEMDDPQNNIYTCRYVIVATGVAQPNKPSFHGSEHVQGYEDLSLDLKEYEDQAILIVGRGNAAFEVAQHLLPATSSIHMMGRSRVKLAWATHYVGDIRAINVGLLDTYQLKSLDGLFEGPVQDLYIKKSQLNGRYYIIENPESDIAPGGNGTSAIDNEATREGYDRIIRCLGFVFDDSLFHSSIKIRRSGGKKKKYPRIKFSYEAIDIPNLYFAGANTHSLDFRKSAGAFIHGYRYTVRTLHRILEWKNHNNKWPAVHFESLLDLGPHVVKRINEASDIYQMFGILCDVVIYNSNKTTADYLEAFPCALISKLPKVTGHQVPGAVMVIALEYGKNFSGPGKDPFVEDRATGETNEAHASNFLHPVLYHYNKLFSDYAYLSRPNKWILPVPDNIHHIVEDFTTKFDAPQSHFLLLRRFLEKNTAQDLRYFIAEQCMALYFTTSKLPLSCKHIKTSSSSQHVAVTNKLYSSLINMKSYLVPFLDLSVE